MFKTHDTTAVMKQAEDLPSLSATATELISMLNNPNAGRQEVANLIYFDEVVAAAVFRYANSAAVGARIHFTNMLEVVDYIGLNAIKNIVLLIAAKQVIQDPKLWLRSVFISGSCGKHCAILDEGGNFNDLSFMLALFHNLGSIVFRANYPTDYQLVQTETDSMKRLELEKQIFGINHLELSAKILESWKFVPELVSLARFQQDVAKFTKANLLVEIYARLFELGEINQEAIDQVLQENNLAKLIKKFNLDSSIFTEDFVNELFDQAQDSVSAW
ncbi:MAG: HDOD domain-containing protein [Candidatus Melainabacteria bacterium]|nr:HDOD domain-containing protein [Candidatus Melainabacteria bacterium]